MIFLYILYSVYSSSISIISVGENAKSKVKCNDVVNIPGFCSKLLARFIARRENSEGEMGSGLEQFEKYSKSVKMVDQVFTTKTAT